MAQLFNCLQAGIAYILPITVINCLEAYISVQRIETLLSLGKNI